MNPALLQEIIALILQIGPLGVSLFLKLESQLNLGPDERVNIANAIASSNAVDDATIAAVSKWMAGNGFKTAFVKA